MFFLVVLLFLPADTNRSASLLRDGLVALQHGEIQQALTDLEQASRLDSKNPYIWSSLAEVYLRLHEPKLASSAADNAALTGGDNPVVCHALAMYYSKTGEPARAGEFEERFAASPKADRDALSRAAELYLNGGNAEKAAALARKAEEKRPSSPNEDLLARAAFTWGQSLLRKGDFTEAANVFETALNARANDPQLTLALGVARYGQRRFDEAIATFLKVIQTSPDIEQPYMFLGRMLDQANARLPEITEDFAKWLAKEPDNPKASLLLAKALLAGGGSTDRAESLLRTSIRLAPDDFESHYELGVLLENKRKYKEAVDELVRSVELDPKQAMSHYHLARVYARLGQPELAQTEREIHAKLTAQKSEIR